MKRFLLNTLVFIQLISFFIASILFITLKISFIFDLYKYFYTKNNLAWHLDITNEQLLSYTENLLNYLKTDSSLDSIWFTKKDILHMIDVRNLYQNTLTLTYILFFIFTITTIIIILLEKKKTLIFITNSFKTVFNFFILLMLILGIYITLDFNSFWINFHLVVFDNDLWLLSPNESNLIKMFPEEFFFMLVAIIVLSITFFFAFLYFAMKLIKNNF